MFNHDAIPLRDDRQARIEIEASLRGENDWVREENTRCLARAAVLWKALSWYAANHRPEDYLNDNGGRAIKALASIDELESVPRNGNPRYAPVAPPASPVLIETASMVSGGYFGFIPCRRCGAVVFVGHYASQDNVEAHDQWHERIQAALSAWKGQS